MKKLFIACFLCVSASLAVMHSSSKSTLNPMLVKNIEALTTGESSSEKTAYGYIDGGNQANPHAELSKVRYWNNGHCVEVNAYNFHTPRNC